jgi:hypothetical protein
VAARTSEGMEQVVNQIMKVVKNEPPNLIVRSKIQPLVDIYASKDSFLVGRSIRFYGKCINGGSMVHLTVIEPGNMQKGKKIASPIVSSTGKWSFEWTPEISIETGEFLMKVADSLNRVSDEISFRIEKGAVTMVAAGNKVYYLGESMGHLQYRKKSTS